MRSSRRGVVAAPDRRRRWPELSRHEAPQVMPRSERRLRLPESAPVGSQGSDTDAWPAVVFPQQIEPAACHRRVGSSAARDGVSLPIVSPAAHSYNRTEPRACRPLCSNGLRAIWAPSKSTPTRAGGVGFCDDTVQSGDATRSVTCVREPPGWVELDTAPTGPQDRRGGPEGGGSGPVLGGEVLVLHLPRMVEGVVGRVPDEEWECPRAHAA